MRSGGCKEQRVWTHNEYMNTYIAISGAHAHSFLNLLVKGLQLKAKLCFTLHVNLNGARSERFQMEKAHLRMVLCVSIAAKASAVDLVTLIHPDKYSNCCLNRYKAALSLCFAVKIREYFSIITLSRTLLDTDHRIWSCLWQLVETLSRAIISDCCSLGWGHWSPLSNVHTWGMWCADTLEIQPLSPASPLEGNLD